MRRTLVQLAVLGGLLCLSVRAHAATERRTAVIVSAQSGGEGTKTLRYASIDAQRMFRIFTTIGGVAPQDAVLLTNPNVDSVLGALSEADRKSDGGTVIFYYSGHAKDGELRLGNSRIAVTALRERMNALSSRLKIAILDSCKSGEFIRAKGGRVGPAFEMSSEPVGPRGLVVLASSAADEDSQESDLLGASFFTHFLASGLLGDADASNDGKVSLQEAYAYAYARTVAQTTEAHAGLQHPTYSYTLAGAGDIWLTDVTRADAMIVLPPRSAGSYVIVNAQKRTVVAEVEKVAGAARKLALPSGTYEVKRRDSDGALFARVQLGKGDTVTLNDGSMTHVALAKNISKGNEWAGDLASVRPTRWTIAAAIGMQQFASASARTGWFPRMPLLGVELELRDRFEGVRHVLGIDLQAGANTLDASVEALSVASRVGQLSGGVSYLYEFGDGRWHPFVGGRLSMLGISRTFEDERFASQGLLTIAPGAVAGINWEATQHLRLGLRARGNYLLYRTDEDLSLGFGDIGVVMKWEL